MGEDRKKENKKNTERESITGGKKNENGENFRKKTDIKKIGE